MTANVVKVGMRFGITPPLDAGYPHDVIEDVALTWHAQAVDSHAAPDSIDLLALAAIGVSWWTEDGPVSGIKLSAAYPTQYRLIDVTAWRVRPTLSAPVTLTVDEPGTNIPNERSLPPQNAYLVGLRTLVDSRRFRGRMFFPPFAGGGGVASVTGGLGDDQLGAMARFCADLAARIVAYEDPPPTWALCVYSREDLDSHAVTRFEIPRHIRTQRRRAFTPTVHMLYGLDGEPP